MTLRDSMVLQGEEVAHYLHVLPPLFVLWHVAGFGESEPFHLLELIEIGLHDTVLRLIVSAVEQESGHRDLVELADDGPFLQRASDMELGRTVPAPQHCTLVSGSPGLVCRTHMVR